MLYHRFFFSCALQQDTRDVQERQIGLELITTHQILFSVNHFDFPIHGPSGPRPPHSWGSAITYRHTTLGRTSLDEWSARHRDLNLTTQSILKKHTCMPAAGFEPTIPASERPQTDALDRWLCWITGWKDTYYKRVQGTLLEPGKRVYLEVDTNTSM